MTHVFGDPNTNEQCARHHWVGLEGDACPGCAAQEFRARYPVVSDEERAVAWVYEYGKHMVEGEPEIPHVDAVNLVRGVAAHLRDDDDEALAMALHGWWFKDHPSTRWEGETEAVRAVWRAEAVDFRARLRRAQDERKAVT